MAARFQRQHCFLCDLPHSPWAILNDFTEPVCRGCCNYEGADRIEDVIQYSRYLRQTWEANNNSTRPRGTKAERHNSAGSSMSSTPSPPPYSTVGSGNSTATYGDQRRTAARFQNSMRLGGQDMPENPHLYSKSTSPDPSGASKGHRPQGQGNMVVRDLQERRGSNFVLDDPRNAIINGNAILQRGHPPLTPNGLSSFPTDAFLRPELVRDTLLRLNAVTPFDIRFKKDQKCVGRVFAFDINNKPGAESEMKVLCEYPRGSGIVFQNAVSLVKQMYSETIKDFAKGLSSGYKYLEYEKNHERSEWKQLSELLPDPVRYFKEPVNPEILPTPYVDPAYPNLPPVNLNFINGRSGHQPFGRKRPRGLDLEEFEIAAGKRAGHPMMRGLHDQHKHQQWLQSQAENVKMTINSTGTPAQLTPAGPIPTAPISPMVSTPISKSIPTTLQISETTYSHSQPKSPINPLRNVPGRFESPGSREEGRQPNGPSTERISPRQRNSPRPSPRSKTPDAPNGQHSEAEKEKSQSILTCSICHDRLEDTHFVQCPSVANHKFCFPCSRKSITAQGSGSEVFCPSGERCPLQGSNLPWAFMLGEIATILGTAADFPVKKEKEV